MTIKVVKTTKQFALFLMLIAGILSCESDIKNMGSNLVDNGVFNVETYNSDVKTYNQNVLKRRAKGLGQYLLGVYHTDDFGKLEASIVTQLLPSETIDFGVNPVIDDVVLSIPYQATSVITDDGTTYELDSVFGDITKEYNLNVYQLTNYLNTLDPLNPSETLKYYSDQTYSYNATPLYSSTTFTPNASDTVYYVNRPEIILDYSTMEFDVDTIKTDAVEPVLRLPLDKTFFTNNFLTASPTEFETPANFITFFNGLYIQATQAAEAKASVMSLNLSLGSNVTIYYTNTEIRDETIADEDQNGDGVIEASANVKVKHTATFVFGGVTTNTYTRDYSGATAQTTIDTPNVVNGDEKLYLQGAAGSMALIELFTNDDLTNLRNNNNWLINEASLTFYIDQSAENANIPEKLFVYNYDDNEQMLDAYTEGPDALDGNLQYDNDGNPEKYTVNITDYVSEILKPTDFTEPSKLVVKVYNSTDLYASGIDIEVKDYNWNPKGVVLHGSQSLDTEKKIKLEITYTKLN